MERTTISSIGSAFGKIVYYLTMGIFLEVLFYFHEVFLVVVVTVLCMLLYTLQNTWLSFVSVGNREVYVEGVFFRKKRYPMETITGIDDFFPIMGIVRVRFQSGSSVYFFARSYSNVKIELEGQWLDAREGH